MDGKSSLACYLMTLDRCYARLCAKYAQRAAAGPYPGSAAPADASAADHAAAARASARLATANKGAPRGGLNGSVGGPGLARTSPGPPPPPVAGRAAFNLADVDFCVFHSPFNKLVRSQPGHVATRKRIHSRYQAFRLFEQGGSRDWAVACMCREYSSLVAVRPLLLSRQQGGGCRPVRM